MFFIYSATWTRVLEDILLSSRPKYLRWALKARAEYNVWAPIYPNSFHLKSSTFKLLLLTFITSPRISAERWVILLFFKSINYRLLKFLTRCNIAINPATDEPMLFHSAWMVTRLGQLMRAIIIISKPSESMLLPFISRCRILVWYCGISWAAI